MTKDQKLQFVNYINQLYGGQQGLVITATRNNVDILKSMSQCMEDIVKLISSCETTEIPKLDDNDTNNATK